MQLTIREMASSDLAQGLLESLIALADVSLSSEEAAKVFRVRLRNGIRTYVACIGDRVIGTASLIEEQKFIHKGGKVGHIEDVVVHANWQHRGVGSALVRHATEQARKLGCYKVILNCFEELATFYESLGYHQHEVGMRVDL